jgi:hypothetical protein
VGICHLGIKGSRRSIKSTGKKWQKEVGISVYSLEIDQAHPSQSHLKTILPIEDGVPYKAGSADGGQDPNPVLGERKWEVPLQHLACANSQQCFWVASSYSIPHEIKSPVEAKAECYLDAVSFRTATICC